MKEKIYEAALALANRCDGAVERDNQGFNATHSATGKYLASMPMNVLSDDEWAFLADHILPTYYKQLEALGFDKKDLKYNHTSKHLSVQGFNDHLRWIKRQIEERDKYRICWSDEAKRLYIVSPFDRNLLNEYREIKPRGVFNKTLGLKEWAYKIESAKDIQAFIERHPNFVVSDEAKEKIAEGLTIEVIPVEEYRIQEVEEYFLVFFPYDEGMYQRIRSVQGSSFAYYEDDKHWKIPKNDITLQDFRGFLTRFPVFHDWIGRVDNILYELRGVKEEREALSKAINASVELDDSKLKMTLRPYQRIGTRFMLDNQRCFNADQMGLGKGLLHGTPVLTEVGYKPIEECVVGDLVAGSDGKFYPITGVYYRGVIPTYRVHFNDKVEMVVDGDHLWNVQNVQNWKRNPDKWFTYSTDELLRRGLHDKAGNNKWRIPLVEPIQFDRVELPLDPYVLGVILGDGCITGTHVGLSNADAFVIEEVRKRIEQYNLKIHLRAQKTIDHIIVRSESKGRNYAVSALKALGLMGKYSHNKYVPHIYKYASIEQRLELLRGLLDTDWYISGKDGIIEYSTVSEQLADDVEFLVQSLGGIARRATKPLYTGKTAHRINIKLNVCPFHLPRRKDLWSPATKYPPNRIIKNITPDGMGEVTCISVGSPDQLFVADHCIVTHNTSESISLLGCGKDTLPALIVVPASLKLNWAKEALSWLDVSVTVIDKKEEHRVRLINGQTVTVQSNQWGADVVIINYDLLAKYEEELSDLRYRTMIIDESHYIKGASTKRTKQVLALSKKAKYRFALSGTPVLNKASELIPQLEFLGRLDDVGGKQNFLRRYCQPTHNGYGWDYNGSSNLEELHKILRQEGIYIRRTKEQVLTELPPKQRITVPLELSGKWQRKYKEAEDDLINYIERQARLHKDFLKSIEHLSEAEQKAKISAWRKEKAQRAAKAEHLVKIQTTKYICAKGKLDSFKEWADDFLATGEKLIVFAHHTDIIEELTEHFKEYNAVYITGSVSSAKRQEHVDRFQNDKDCRVIVCNLQAGGVGITLTAASNVATLEFAWTAGLHDQVEDRSNRIGQVNAVNCWYFTGVDTIDDYLIGIVEGKRTVTDALIDGTTDTPKEGVIGDLSKWMLIKDNKTKNALAEYSEDILSALFEQE